ncbi:MAG TPA: hypothetical protein VFF72_10955, partial [Caldimonas sp.]|nr:hypothetical protein [Caldimonas sp.]
DDADRLVQLAAVLAVGSAAVWPATPATDALRAALPPEVRQSIASAIDWRSDTVSFDAVLHHGDADSLQGVLRQVAGRRGPIVSVRGLRPGEVDVPLASLVVERALSTNTAAAGGNASLMTLD